MRLRRVDPRVEAEVDAALLKELKAAR